MSTRSRFEKIQTLLDAIETVQRMGTELPPSIWNAVQNVQEEFKDELAGDSINITWGISDVQDVYRDSNPNKELTDEEARDILSELERKHDASIGISWDVIQVYVDDNG
jgi:hypothetical protein